jgi:hypothetical protein
VFLIQLFLFLISPKIGAFHANGHSIQTQFQPKNAFDTRERKHFSPRRDGVGALTDLDCGQLHGARICQTFGDDRRQLHHTKVGQKHLAIVPKMVGLRTLGAELCGLCL